MDFPPTSRRWTAWLVLPATLPPGEPTNLTLLVLRVVTGVDDTYRESEVRLSD
jgi:hypothetical protein